MIPFADLPCDDAAGLLVDGRVGYELRLHEGALHVTGNDRPMQRIPLRRIGRVVMRCPTDPALCAVLELVSRGVPVHFQSSSGDIIASMVGREAMAGPDVEEALRQAHSANAPARYAEWKDLQLQHAMSRIMRGRVRMPVLQFEDLLRRHAAGHARDNEFEAAWNEVSALCFAWVDATLTRMRLRPLVQALAQRECLLVRDLDRILAIPLLWQFSAWLCQALVCGPRQRATFFADACRNQLETSLLESLAALQFHLRGATRRRSAKASRRRATRSGTYSEAPA